MSSRLRKLSPVTRRKSPRERLHNLRKPPRQVHRWAWPAGLAAAGGAWYVSDSLRHRRDGAFGYQLGSDLEVDSPDFVRAAEALTGSPIVEGNHAELFINGDRIFPAILETIRSAQRTLNLETYVYWRGDITNDVAEAVSERARAGVRCNVILDALGSAMMDRSQVKDMEAAGVNVVRFRPVKPYTLRRLANRSHRRALVVDGAWSSVGTVNFDNRSFQLHDEVTLCVWDRHFAGLLTEAYEADLARSDEIERERWEARGPRRRAAEKSMRVLRREL